jgi:hypothetical protein
MTTTPEQHDNIVLLARKLEREECQRAIAEWAEEHPWYAIACEEVVALLEKRGVSS